MTPAEPHQVREFAGAAVPTPLDPSDDGSPSPALQSALTSVAAGRATGVDVLQALAGARLLVPVVALLDEVEVDGEGRQREKESSMATIIAESPQHGRALLAFSSTDAMKQWRADARPVAVLGPLAARAALAESVEAMVVDIEGPIAFAISGDELLLLAAVARPRDGQWDDPVLHTAIARLLPHSLGNAFALRPSGGGAAAVSLELRLPSDASTDDPGLQKALVSRIAHDPVVRQLCPGGLRVTFGDTRASGTS